MSEFSFHATVRGAMHVQHGIECQDASGSITIKEVGAYAFAVADGHGDPSCIRSAKGSRIAVRTALRLLSEFAYEFQGRKEVLQNSALRSEQFFELARRIITAWRTKVLADYKKNPLTNEQWDALNAKDRVLTRERPAHVYGTTLIAGILLPEVLLLLQQGDGCCVVLDEQGLAYCPIPDDERCLANLTTSLCDVDAEDRVRIAEVEIRDRRICACFVGSDGVDKSLRGETGLYDFCTEVALDALGSSNAEAMQAVVAPSLTVLSEQGSGDDTSLAGFVDVMQVAACAQELVIRHERYTVENERSQLTEQLNSMRRMHDWCERTPPENDDDEERKERERFFATYETLKKRLEALETIERANLAQRKSESSLAQNGHRDTRVHGNAREAKQASVAVVDGPIEETRSISQTSSRETTPSQSKQPKDASLQEEAGKRRIVPVVGAVLAVLILAIGVALGYMVLPKLLGGETQESLQQEVRTSTTSKIEDAKSTTDDEPSDDKEKSKEEDVFKALKRYYYNKGQGNELTKEQANIGVLSNDYAYGIISKVEAEGNHTSIVLLKRVNENGILSWKVLYDQDSEDSLSANENDDTDSIEDFDYYNQSRSYQEDSE